MDSDICNNGSQGCSLLRLVPSPQLLKELPPGSSSSSSLSPSSPLSPTASFRSSATSYEDFMVPADSVNQLDGFLRDALNSRNRMTVLRLELEIEKFVLNQKLQQLFMNLMPSSYERLAAHRVAQYYYVQSMAVDSTTPPGTRVLLMKTPDSRIPSVKLVDVPVDSKAASPLPGKLAIKQRTKEALSSSGSYGSGRTTPVKSVEERMEDYNKARARIFGDRETTSRASEPVQKIIELKASVESTCSRPEMDGHEDEIGAKAANTVAVFRDREKDMKDPDYDRKRFLQPSRITALSPSIASAVGSSSSNGTSLVQSGYGQFQRQAGYSASDNQGCITWVGQPGLPIMGYPIVLPEAATPGFYSYSSNGYNCDQKLVHPGHYSSVDWCQGPSKVKPYSMSSNYSGWFQSS